MTAGATGLRRGTREADRRPQIPPAGTGNNSSSARPPPADARFSWRYFRPDRAGNGCAANGAWRLARRRQRRAGPLATGSLRAPQLLLGPSIPFPLDSHTCILHSSSLSASGQILASRCRSNCSSSAAVALLEERHRNFAPALLMRPPVSSGGGALPSGTGDPSYGPRAIAGVGEQPSTPCSHASLKMPTATRRLQRMLYQVRGTQQHLFPS